MSDKYAGERYKPVRPQCGRGQLALRFDGAFLMAQGAREPFSFRAVSGRKTDTGFDYSPERQAIPSVGPIPEGAYWIDFAQLQENSLFRLRNPRAAWGDFWITIHPFPETQTHGRGGFFIHGGTEPGSAGCIDLAGLMNGFVDALRKELKDAPECYIPLTVAYPKRKAGK